ncbi:unnamed protein product [Lathyrus sativus]|nr:unnamed protein product [Lathyrus sativus]
MFGVALAVLGPFDKPQATIPDDSEDDSSNDRTVQEVELPRRESSGRGDSVTESSHGKKKGMVLPFEPDSITFDDIVYYVVMLSEHEKHIPDLHVLISKPFHPAYVTAERIKKAKNLELLLIAGIGSDHIDLNVTAAAGLTVAEVTGSNTMSVAEDELMRILILVRNFVPGYHQSITGEWNVAGISHRAYDLEGKTVGTVSAGRIGKLLLQRLKPFNCNLLYHDRLKIEPELEKEIGAKFEEDLDIMLPKCDVVVINTPLTEKTRGLFNKNRIAKLKKGVLIVNNARGAIMDTQAVADACSSGHIGGYSRDVWFPQPAPKDHPWRYMPNHAMTPHISGTTIDAHLRYAAGVKDMLKRHFKGEDFPQQNYIVKEGELASQYR